MHGRIRLALEAVAKEVALVQRRLRKRTGAQDTDPEGGVTPA
jgi:hypothetical protein